MLMDAGPGQVLGRYELLMPVARGGMAMVWAARLKGSRGFQKLVAIKTMLPSMSDDPNFEKMFLDEASLASEVRHPHVIEILDLGEQDNVLYLVMEWVDGEPLNVLMNSAAKQGGVPLRIALSLASQACRGLHAAHELRDEQGALVGLVHRDITPQNILVSYDGVVKLVDFGVAKATSRMSAETEAGQLKGKIAYMSPEQLRGGAIDRRTDVFAMGILIYMLVTGVHPFRGDDQTQTIENINSPEPVTSPRKYLPSVSEDLEAVLLQALAKDPAQRFPSANDLLKALTRVLPPATDEEVAEYVRTLLADRLEKRRRSVRAALELADEREASSPLASASPFEEVRPPADDVATIVNRSIAPPPPDFASSPEPELSSEISLKPPRTGFDSSHSLDPWGAAPLARSRGRRWPVVAAAGSLLLLGGIVFGVVTTRAEAAADAGTVSVPGEEATRVARATPEASEATAELRPELRPSEGSVANPPAVTEGAALESPSSARAPEPEAVTAAPRTTARPAAVVPDKSGVTSEPVPRRPAKTFVTPVRDPGF